MDFSEAEAGTFKAIPEQLTAHGGIFDNQNAYRQGAPQTGDCLHYPALSCAMVIIIT